MYFQVNVTARMLTICLLIVEICVQDQNLTNGEKSPNQNGSIPKVAPVSYSSNSNSNYREIIRVVNTQREKLTSQQAELTQVI
jgi:hypothetical protein